MTSEDRQQTFSAVWMQKVMKNDETYVHCETRRVGKDDGKGWNVIIPPESVVFWPIVISHLLSGEGNSTN